RNGTKISEDQEKQIQKPWVKKVSSLSVTEFATGQFAQSGREVTPEIGINNWIEWEGEALPDRAAEHECKHTPVENFQGLPGFIACGRCDHFQGSEQCLKYERRIKIQKRAWESSKLDTA